MAARKMRRRIGSADAEARPAPEGERTAERGNDSAEAALARRYLDLWERNLTHLALHGPDAGGKGRH